MHFLSLTFRYRQASKTVVPNLFYPKIYFLSGHPSRGLPR